MIVLDTDHLSLLEWREKQQTQRLRQRLHGQRAVLRQHGQRVLRYAARTAVGGALTIAVPKHAAALPAYASSTGKACGACHTNPAGGGARTAYGDAFAANGHKPPGKK